MCSVPKMFKHASNQALLQNVSSYCMIIECDNRTPLILRDEQGELHSAHVHGSSAISDYIVFKKDEGLFKSVPELMSPQLIDKYLVMGCAFGEKTISVRVGHISSVSTGYRGFFYGDSGGLPGFSGVILSHIELAKQEPFSV
ncbi:hypothetical protein PRIPAC_90726 [Pristionchus pacificus]|uniref:Uncharacterized protein n=1 Tax=Pristionchus pacificus TaxID=54126 RepID=A0A2A6B6A6_PRIPA|nr:hypothetical protein PRIPAC_90726 [Pristionchus pacificus]|eukprot:PDM61383.1 hypothetical protein PRIPAC_50825 [Pristionchus pacificus]